MGSSHPECLDPKAAASFGSAHDIQEVRGKDKRYMLSVHAQKVLSVAQDVPKVNVEQVPCKVRETKAFHSSSGDLQDGLLVRAFVHVQASHLDLRYGKYV